MSEPTSNTDAPKPETGPFDSVRDLVLPLTALLGSTRISVRECLELKPNSVLTLSQSVGEDLELRVNNVLIAHGEVVVLEDGASVRVTRIATNGSGG